jgi:GT2 family glycosyltransferase
VTGTPHVAVVVVTYNCGSFLDEFASSYAALTYANKKLWLVDSASTDGSGHRLPLIFPDAEVLQSQHNLGFASAVNMALLQCLRTRPDFVLLLNPDAIPAPDCLERLLEGADQGTLTGAKVLSAVSGLLATHAGPFSWFRGNSTRTNWGMPEHLAFLKETEVDAAGFVCMLIPGAVFQKLGLLDESFGMYVEDSEFCIRARRAGFRIRIQPNATVKHLGQASSEGRQKEFYQYYSTRNHAFLIARYPGPRRYFFLAVNCGLCLWELAHFIKRLEWSLVRAQVLGLRDFLRGRHGMTYQPQDFGAS